MGCRPEAYRVFAQQIARIDSTNGLLHAAIAIAMHALDDVVPAMVEGQLEAIASRVRQRFRSQQPAARLAHLHQVFFEEEGFRGDTENYYNPLNSYVPAVLTHRRGIPITLTLLYKVVAEKVGVEVRGINAPGHFLASVVDESGSLIVDPFFGGRVLSRDEAFTRISQVLGQPCPRDDRFLPECSHRQWLLRMLANLQHVFAAQDRQADLVAMNELAQLLAEENAGRPRE